MGEEEILEGVDAFLSKSSVLRTESLVNLMFLLDYSHHRENGETYTGAEYWNTLKPGVVSEEIDQIVEDNYRTDYRERKTSRDITPVRRKRAHSRGDEPEDEDIKDRVDQIHDFFDNGFVQEEIEDVVMGMKKDFLPGPMLWRKQPFNFRRIEAYPDEYGLKIV